MQVAEDASLSVSGAGQRAEALRESLAGELEQARLVAQAAQAARQQADRDITCAQSKLNELREQEEAQKVGNIISIWDPDKAGKLSDDKSATKGKSITQLVISSQTKL